MEAPNTQPRRNRLKQRRRRESGTALTEFVIVVPLFILLIFWSEFLCDLGLVKLKVEEATRYALWETAAERDWGTVSTEIQHRFADLSSPQDIQSSTPVGTRSFKQVSISTGIVTNIDAPFDGHVQLNWGGGIGGFLGRIIGGIANFIGRTVDSLVGDFHFETHREAQATVTFSVQNTLFPGGQMLHILFDSGIPGTITMTGRSPVMLLDTWKAWPGPWSTSSQDVTTDVYQTYATNGGASAPENEVSARLQTLAFFGLRNNFVGDVLSGLITITGFMEPFSTTTWRDNSGPIAMLPGDNASHSWVPGSGLGSQRLGDQAFPQSPAIQPSGGVQDSPNPGVDRARSTVPSFLHTGFWHTAGGMSGVAAFRFTNYTNPYQAEYRCRDAFYLGAVAPDVQRYNNPNANRTAFPECW